MLRKFDSTAARFDVTGCPQVLKRRRGVLAPTGFAGVDEAALAVAAIVEGEDVDAGGVQARHIVERVAEVAVRGVHVKDCVAG